MLEMPADRREAFEVLDRLLAPRLTARAKGRADDLLEQRRLAVGLVEHNPPAAPVRLHYAELLELSDEALRDARLVQDLLQGHGRDGGIDRGRAPRGRGFAAAARPAEIAARELLSDDSQGKEL